ncbi:MAG: cytidylyltransferase [Oligoflexia bacterium]|nr:cytidylyltransferase [Oligoflexia bacterium]
MVVGLLVGKDRSIGFPDKHKKLILGRPLVEYAFLSATHSKKIERLFVSSDSPFIMDIGEKYGATTLLRPKELAQPDTLLEDSLIYAYKQMEAVLETSIDTVVLFFANAPMIPPGSIDKGIELLQEKSEYDSVFSVCKYNMFSPARAYKLTNESEIAPFIDKNAFDLEKRVTSIRDSQGDCFFCTLQVQILRGRCFTHMDEGQLTYKWMGRRSYAMVTDIGFDIDYDWQIPTVEGWLVKTGFTDKSTPYDLLR